MGKYKLAKKTYVVGSGKGGVGKSTVTLNLAIALGLQKAEVGVFDGDIYGPSIPIMTGLRRLSPKVAQNDKGQERVLPFQKFGTKLLSIGFFMEESRSAIWRGPMLHGTLEKMIRDVEWGKLDYLFIDLPPGTGDVQISLAQLLEINGAIVVTTPQEVAMLDAIKAINSFENLQIPLLGIVENMAGFTPPNSNETFDIFGKGKGEELAKRFNTPLLGSIPLTTSIRTGGDEGHPPAFHNDDAGKHFKALATAIANLQTTASPFA